MLVAIGLLLGMIPPAAASGYDAAKIEPSLAQAVTKDPKKVYQVIVQAEPARSLDGRKANLAALDALLRDKDEDGVYGKTRTQLDLVNGFAGQLTGKRILQLSQMPGVKSISGDHRVKISQSTIDSTIADGGSTTTTSTTLQSMQTIVAQAPDVWSTLAVKGQGVTVAILDSGIASNSDLPNAAFGVDTATGTTALGDPGGHGTHVAGVVAGTGQLNVGKWKGLAPAVRLLSVKVTNDTGSASYSSLIKGLQWVVANRKAQNIRVVNISLGSTQTRSYKQDPLAAAVEMAWFSGVVVVTSAGNRGAVGGAITMPGADPYVITVGANNDKSTSGLSDDVIPTWSSRGPTAYDGLQKPDIVASGNRVISLRSPGSYIERQLGLSRIVDQYYYRLSGTSMAAPVVSGVAALLLTVNPALTPNQVKYIIKSTAKPLPTYYDANTQGAGQVDSMAAVRMAQAGVTDQANKGIRPSDVFARSIYTLAQGAPTVWRDPAYAGRDWSTWGWSSGTWDSATWDNLVWEKIDWANATWTSATWESLTGWSNGTWTASASSGTWDSGTWDSGTWDSGTWDNGQWDSLLSEDSE